NIGLDAEVVSDNMETILLRLGKTPGSLPGAFAPFFTRTAADHFGQILARHAGIGRGQRDGFLLIVADKYAGALGAPFAQATGKFAGINARDGNNPLFFQIVGQRLGSTEIGKTARAIPDDQTRRVNL